MSKVLMVALVSHITSVGMVTPGDEFEVSEAVAKEYEKRTRRPLAERADPEEDEGAGAKPQTATKRAAKSKFSGKAKAAKDSEQDSADTGSDAS